MSAAFLRSVGWGGLLLLFLAAVVIPVANRATVCADDFVWITNAWSDESMTKALSVAWSSNFFFRPIDILANRLISPRTLDLKPMLAVQLAGLLFLTMGMWRLFASVGITATAPRIVATAWLWLHPSTQLSVWSAGGSSQTWCAAFGVWTINAVLSLPRERIDWRNLVMLAVLSAAGIVAKELFLGWATAAAVAITVREAIVQGERRLWATVKTTVPAVCAVLLPSSAWVVSRLWCSRLGEVINDTSGELYTLHGPATVLVNVATAVLGMFVQGPIHWARLLGLPWMLVPFVGAALSGMFAFIGSTRSAGTVERVPKGLVLPLVVMLGTVAVWPALLIGKVSELYLLGPNALIAVLVGIGATSHEGLAALGRRVAAATMFLIAFVGFASRSYHFAVTWSQARELREAVERIAAAAPTSARVVIVVPESLRSGPMHSKYCTPPAVAAGLPQSWFVKRLVDPTLPEVDFVTPIEGSARENSAVILEAPSRRRVIW